MLPPSANRVVEHGQRAWVAQAHRARVLVGLRAEAQLTRAERLGARVELHVRLDAAHRLIVGASSLGGSVCAGARLLSGGGGAGRRGTQEARWRAPAHHARGLQG